MSADIAAARVPPSALGGGEAFSLDKFATGRG